MWAKKDVIVRFLEYYSETRWVSSISMTVKIETLCKTLTAGDNNVLNDPHKLPDSASRGLSQQIIWILMWKNILTNETKNSHNNKIAKLPLPNRRPNFTEMLKKSWSRQVSPANEETNSNQDNFRNICLTNIWPQQTAKQQAFFFNMPLRVIVFKFSFENVGFLSCISVISRYN